MCGRFAITLPQEAVRAFFAYVEQPKKKKKPEADAISDAEAMMIAIILAMDDD